MLANDRWKGNRMVRPPVHMGAKPQPQQPHRCPLTHTPSQSSHTRITAPRTPATFPQHSRTTTTLSTHHPRADTCTPGYALHDAARQHGCRRPFARRRKRPAVLHAEHEGEAPDQRRQVHPHYYQHRRCHAADHSRACDGRPGQRQRRRRNRWRHPRHGKRRRHERREPAEPSRHRRWHGRRFPDHPAGTACVKAHVCVCVCVCARARVYRVVHE